MVFENFQREVADHELGQLTGILKLLVIGYETENISEYPKQPHTLEIDAKFQISLKNLKYGYRDILEFEKSD